MRSAVRRNLCSVGLLMCLAVGMSAGCASEEKETAPPPAPKPNVPVTNEIPGRPQQPDGEAQSPSRPQLTADFRAFLRDRVFWTRGGGVRIEVPAQVPLDRPRFIWINPTGIEPGWRYGSDITLVTDGSAAHYSPGDIEKINDGNTFLITPPGVHTGKLSGGTNLVMYHRQNTALHGVRIETTKSAAPSVRGQGEEKHHIGFIIFLDLDGDSAIDLNVWYTGPLQASEQLAKDVMRYPVDVLITPVNEPSALSPSDIMGLAQGVQAKVIVPVGFASPSDPAIANLTANSRIPVWVPPGPEATATAN